MKNITRKKHGCILIRVWHPNYELSYLSNIFLMISKREWIVGSQRTTPAGELLTGTNRESYWCSESKFFYNYDEFLNIFSVLSKQIINVEHEIDNLIRTGGKVEFYIQLSGTVNTACIFIPSSLAIFGELGIVLSIEVFPEMN